jgi:hypothetical protein
LSTIDLPSEVVVERPKNRDHGDWATNVAMQWAVKLGSNPRELAVLLAKELESVLKENEPLQYQVKTDWVLDSQTIGEHNLEPSTPVIKAGVYPIERIDGQLKILFTLMPLTSEKVNKK